MKKFVTMIGLVVLAGLFMTTEKSQAASPTEPQIIGDVNCDGVVTKADVKGFATFLRENVTATGCSPIVDLNCDGTADRGDLIFLRHYLRGVSNEGTCVIGEPLSLGVGEARVSSVIQTPEGPMAIVLESQDQLSPAAGGLSSSAQIVSASTWRWKGCSVYIQHVVSPTWWKMTLYSSFSYNYSAIVQDPPRLETNAAYPYSWSNQQAWNSTWTSDPRYKFADGLAVLHSNAPILGGIWSVTKHIWIQEDAWGNCTPHW